MSIEKVGSCLRAAIPILFLTICCCPSVGLADYIRATPECARAQQQLKSLEMRRDQLELAAANVRLSYEDVIEDVGQVDHRNLQALADYVSKREQASRALQQANIQSSAASTQFYDFQNRFNSACYVHIGPPVPAPVPPAPPPPGRAGLRIENVGDRRIYFSILSRSNGVTKVCDVDAVDSNAAMEPSIGTCSGEPLEMSLHNGHEVVYYKLDLSSIYQIYWNGREWRLKYANRR
jgi:hypothetical protein